MKWAAQIRESLRELFGPTYSELLRQRITSDTFQHERELEDVRKERDYFKGRAERLELMLIPDRARPSLATFVDPNLVVGRRTWDEIQREHEEIEFSEEANGREAVREQGNAAPLRPDAQSGAKQN
jgi:hypothetical protein